jgi:hypothetical protein
MTDRVAVELTHDERAILARGLIEWGGPATATDEIAHLLGFNSVADLYETGHAIADALRAGESLSALDWRRALFATELVFASDIVGSGVEWPITTGFTDDETIRALRAVQRKLGRIARLP